MRHDSFSALSAASHWYWTIATTAILLLGVLFFAYGVQDRQAVLSSGEHSAQEIAEHTALSTTAVLDANRQLLRAMAILADRASPTSTRDSVWVREELMKLKSGNPDIMDLLIIGADGKIAYWTGDGTPPIITDREYFTFHARSLDSGLHLGEPLLSKVHKGRWFFPISEALRDNEGRLRRVVVAIIDVAMMRHLISLQRSASDSTQVLMSSNRKIYTRNPDHDLHVGKQISLPPEVTLPTVQQLAVTASFISPLDQKQRIVSFRRLPKYPLIAAGSIDVDSLLQSWRQRMVLIASLWMALSLVVLWLARRARDISRRQTVLANIDALTGVYNRRSILHTATVVERSRSHDGQLSLLMIDVDHFKAINDRFGHSVGDDVLRNVTTTIRQALRATDIIGRYGGEEFLVIMPDTGTDGAIQVAEKIRLAVAGQVQHPNPVTISIGVATLDLQDASFDAAQSRADAALYLAKACGRNCVRTAPCSSVHSDPN